MELLPWYVYALSGAFVVAVAAVLEKKILEKEEPVHFSFAVTLVGGVLSLPFLAFVPWHELSLTELSLIAVITAASACSFWLVAKATKVLDAGEISVLLATTPAAIALFAYVFLGEALSQEQVIALLCILAGLFILELPHVIQIFRRRRLFELFFMGMTGVAILIYAGTALIDRIALTTFGIHPLHFIVLTQTMSMLIFGIIELCLGRGRGIALSPFVRSPIKVVAVATLLFLSRVLYAQAIALVYVALAAALKRTGAVFTIILSGAFLKEQGIGRKLVSVLLVILGALLLV